MRVMAGRGSADLVRTSLNFGGAAVLCAVMIAFGAATALAAGSSGGMPANAGGFRPIPSAGGAGAATGITAAPTPAAASGAGGSLKAADVAGRYVILRPGKDTGCMVTLDDKARGPKGSFKAVLASGCNDQGILIFDPAGWEVTGGRLALVARKGHQTHLDRQPDGSWAKDPKEGAPLQLQRR